MLQSTGSQRVLQDWAAEQVGSLNIDFLYLDFFFEETT